MLVPATGTSVSALAWTSRPGPPAAAPDLPRRYHQSKRPCTANPCKGHSGCLGGVPSPQHPRSTWKEAFTCRLRSFQLVSNVPFRV